MQILAVNEIEIDLPTCTVGVFGCPAGLFFAFEMIVILLDERSLAVDFSWTVLAISIGPASRITACNGVLPLCLALMVLLDQIREVLLLGLLHLYCTLLLVLSWSESKLVV